MEELLLKLLKSKLLTLLTTFQINKLKEDKEEIIIIEMDKEDQDKIDQEDKVNKEDQEDKVKKEDQEDKDNKEDQEDKVKIEDQEEKETLIEDQEEKDNKGVQEDNNKIEDQEEIKTEVKEDHQSSSPRFLLLNQEMKVLTSSLR